MKARMDFRKASPQADKAMVALHIFVRNCGLDHTLLELIKLRASQLNGCAHCIDMHTKELRADGESEQRLYLLDAWRESPFYSERERAALAWTEAVTLVTDGHVPDAVYEEARGNSARGTGQPDHGAGGDQRREPPQHRVPHRPGQSPGPSPRRRIAGRGDKATQQKRRSRRTRCVGYASLVRCRS